MGKAADNARSVRPNGADAGQQDTHGGAKEFLFNSLTISLKKHKRRNALYFFRPDLLGSGSDFEKLRDFVHK